MQKAESQIFQPHFVKHLYLFEAHNFIIFFCLFVVNRLRAFFVYAKMNMFCQSLVVAWWHFQFIAILFR